MSFTVSVTLTDSEYEAVKKAADQEGLTISQYVKRFPIGEDEFEIRYALLKEKALTYEANKKFTVMSLFDDWNSLPLSLKLSLGRNFYHLVKRGELKDVSPAGKNSSNVQLYIRNVS